MGPMLRREARMARSGAACCVGSGNLERDAAEPAPAPLAEWTARHGWPRASAQSRLPVHRRRSERDGTLKGNKAHGWIGCAASETADVHYGLVSGVKP